jgi:SAM-dependent methyltransferase
MPSRAPPAAFPGAFSKATDIYFAAASRSTAIVLFGLAFSPRTPERRSVRSPATARPPCNACGGKLTDHFPRVVDPQTDDVFEIVTCERCGLGHTLPQPDDLGPYYGGAYHGRRHGFTERYCVRRRTRFVAAATGPGEGRRLLDVGCGDGTFLLEARRDGWDVAGTEMNTAIARAAGLRVWSDLEGAREHAPYACITSWHSLEHMRSPRDTVAAAARLLEPGGVLLLAVPNAEGLQARAFGPHWLHLDVPRHLFHFGPRSLAALVGSAGLSVMWSRHMEVEYDLFGWAQSALNWAFAEPNMFFYQLTGKPTKAGPIVRSASLAAGAALTALSVPLTAAGGLASSGAVLVMATRRPAD